MAHTCGCSNPAQLVDQMHTVHKPAEARRATLVSRIREGRELVEEPLGQLGVHRERDALVRVVKLVKVACVERVCDLGLEGGLDLLGKQ